MSAAIATTLPVPARVEAQRILREVEDLRDANHRLGEVKRVATTALRGIEMLLSHDLSRMRAVRELAQGALADVQRLAPEVKA